MERLLAITKLTALAVAIVVAILCLGYSNAYGLTAPMQLTKPGEQSQVSQNPAGMNSSTQFDFDIEDCDGFSDNEIITGTRETCPPIPEPTTLILLGFGLAGIKLLKRRS